MNKMDLLLTFPLGSFLCFKLLKNTSSGEVAALIVFFLTDSCSFVKLFLIINQFLR